MLTYARPFAELHGQCKTGHAVVQDRLPNCTDSARPDLPTNAVRGFSCSTAPSAIQSQVHRPSTSCEFVPRPNTSALTLAKAKSSAHAKCTLAVDRNTPTSIYYYVRHILCVPADFMIMHTHKSSINRREMETSATMVRF